MILVTGATGHLGKAIIQFLVERGVPPTQLAALVRDETKAADLKALGIALKTGTYDDYASLVGAFAGVDKLLFISSSENDPANRTAQHKRVVKAAKESGVNHLFYTSFERKNETDTSPTYPLTKPHLDTEHEIKDSGITYTLFRNNLYAEALPMLLGPQALESGIVLPAANGKAAFAVRQDLAEATANVLTTTGHENNEYHFSNAENVSFDDVAQMLSAIAGKPVPYVSPTPEEFLRMMPQSPLAGLLLGFAEAVKQGEFYSESTDLERMLCRKPTTVKDYLATVYGSR